MRMRNLTTLGESTMLKGSQAQDNFSWLRRAPLAKDDYPNHNNLLQVFSLLWVGGSRTIDCMLRILDRDDSEVKSLARTSQPQKGVWLGPSLASASSLSDFETWPHGFQLLLQFSSDTTQVQEHSITSQREVSSPPCLLSASFLA